MDTKRNHNLQRLTSTDPVFVYALLMSVYITRRKTAAHGSFAAHGDGRTLGPHAMHGGALLRSWIGRA